MAHAYNGILCSQHKESESVIDKVSDSDDTSMQWLKDELLKKMVLKQLLIYIEKMCLDFYLIPYKNRFQIHERYISESSLKKT